METTLAPTTQPHEERIKKSLHQSISKRKTLLAQLLTKLETLQMELDAIRHEYHVRIGSLILQDNQLDLEIIRYKNILTFMEQGKTYEEALKAIEDHFYSDILRMQAEQEKIEEEKRVVADRRDVSPEIQDEIKELWKKLIRKFHPDLVTDHEEKTKREDMMKKINHAYAENDLDTLQFLLAHQSLEITKESTIEMLEKSLAETENMIMATNHALSELKKSQWYTWRSEIEKSKKTGKDVFRGLENSLIDDLLKKIATARELQEKIERMRQNSPIQPQPAS